MKVSRSLSCVQLFVTPWALACQVPLSMELSRQECWSEFPFPPPRDLPDPEMEPQSPVLGRFFTVWAIRKVAFKMTLGFLLGQLQISTWCLPSTYLSTRIKSCADAADFQHPQEEFRVESGNKALWENWQLFRELDILSRWFYKPNSCITSRLGKH